MRALLFAACVVAAYAQQAPTGDPSKPVRLGEIKILGSRLPSSSLVRLLGLKIGVTVEEKTIRDACGKLLLTGLIKNIDYVYESMNNSDAVALELTVEDEKNLIPAKIAIPNVSEEDAWRWLQELDPLFTRELPNTEKAIGLYQRNLQNVVRKNGHDMTIGAEMTGAAGRAGSAVTFHPVVARELKKKK